MNKILIIRLTSLGDVIFTIPLACALKNHDPDTKIGWLVAEKGLELVKNNPCVDNCHFVPLAEWKKHPFSLKTLKEFIQVVKEIRKEQYDIAFDCQQMLKSLFLFEFCGAKRRITFKDARELSNLGGNEFITPKKPFRDFEYHIVERNLDFARHLGVNSSELQFSLPEISQKAKTGIDELTKSLDKSKPMVVLSPATTWENKHWAEENWANVIEAIHAKCNLVFTGTDKDTAILDSILAKTNENINYLNLIGKTNVEELRELFLRAKVVISPDSGSAYLAWASQKPAVITIFTCTPPKRFGAYGNDEKYFSLGSNLPCQPCFKKTCHLRGNKNVCRKSPKPNKIIKIVNNLLQ
ncbi:MAG: glycosyltransferase family 9 protein [Candidatus Gastranaerophilales bacterium]|nr:glycosyltransferase family 9 protein [Candidatus Gastranaerophilales bacterium]